MKKTALTGVLATMLMTTGAAFANEPEVTLSTLTTKNYVDSGLRFVYQAAQDAATSAATNAGNISSLQTTVNGQGSTITGIQNAIGSTATEGTMLYDIDQLQTKVSALEGAGFGADITALEESVAANSASIASNAEDIAANATAIQSNAEDIAANAESIATNAENIAANAEAIASHTTTLGSHATAIQSNAEAIASHTTTLGSHATAIQSNATAIEALQTTIGNMDGTAYSGVNGVTIDNNHNVGLNVTAEQGEMYIYTQSGWQALPVQDTWSSSIFN